MTLVSRFRRRTDRRKMVKNADTVASESLRRTLMPLLHRGFNSADLSEMLAKWGRRPDKKTLERIFRGETQRTHRIAGGSSVVFDNLVATDIALYRVARLAHHIHELIGSARRDGTRPDDLANALAAADDLCAIYRASSTEVVAGVLDFLAGVAKLSRVATSCGVEGPDQALRMLEDTMSLLRSSIDRLRSFRADDDSDYVDLFLIPAYENLLACASDFDERAFDCPFNSAQNPRTAARDVVHYLNRCGAMRALRRYAEKCNCAIVAYNLAEYAGLTGNVDEVEKAFLLCFKLRRPGATGEWRLPEMTDDPRNVPYLSAGYDRALKRFEQRNEKGDSAECQGPFKRRIKGAAFGMLLYVTGISIGLSIFIAEALAFVTKPIIH
ncbi:hypothetical protein [Mesorhizobium sp. L48C026A00]|uniref:hypothetical protein n=1 Tax=Mesorhizobium sp. L48C026A00 TaxID=1287182 RepID=UPI000408EDD5|nr:hypothetical protein [Mesorhizobium sp. L48C026A00]